MLNYKGNSVDILDQYDAILKRRAEDFNFESPQQDPEEMFAVMRDIMCTNNGIGLAGPQVGLPYRMFVMGNPDDKDSCIAVFNPIMLSTIGDETVSYDEGCLTFPGLFIRVKRPRAIRVRYTNEKGSTDTVNFEGLTARVFLHEYDHLDGILYTQRANRYHVEKAKKDLMLLKRKKAARR
jgi:peptide deformylase